MKGEFIDNSKQVLDELQRKTIKALEGIGGFIEGEAKEELNATPMRIDTGLLWNSITHAISGEAPKISSYKGNNPSKYGGTSIPSGRYTGTAPTDPGDKPAVYIGTNVNYAVYVHEGTSRMAPNRFLKNAIEVNKDQIQNRMKEELKS